MAQRHLALPTHQIVGNLKKPGGLILVEISGSDNNYRAGARFFDECGNPRQDIDIPDVDAQSHDLGFIAKYGTRNLFRAVRNREFAIHAASRHAPRFAFNQRKPKEAWV